MVEALCQRGVTAPKASRLDVYADVAGWVLTDEHRRGLVTHAKLRPVLRAGTDEYETIQVGKQPGALVRLYREDIKERSTPGFADLFWGGHLGPVVRVEAEAGSKKLREVGIVSVDDALSCYGELWKYATAEFCQLRVPGPRECFSDRWRRGLPAKACSILARRWRGCGIATRGSSQLLTKCSRARWRSATFGCRGRFAGGTSRDAARRLAAGQRGRTEGEPVRSPRSCEGTASPSAAAARALRPP